MSSFNRNRLKYKVNENFFDKWTSRVAYILGFTYADGNIYRTSLSWDIQKRDLDVLEKINKALHSNYPIREQRGSSYRLRINNQILIGGALKRGLFPNKSSRIVFPKIPKELVRHFIRGYLDGDGWIVHRTGRNEIDLGFVCGNRNFLDDIEKELKIGLGIIGRVRGKTKITPRGIRSLTYHLEYYSSNAVDIAGWLYDNLSKDDISLKRKRLKYIEARRIYELIWSRFRSRRLLQKEYGKSLKDILLDLHFKKHLNGMQISKVLKTSKSSVYRWLELTGAKCLNYG